MVSVNASGLLGTTTFPLLVRRFKPESRLKPGDVSTTKPQVAIELVKELVALGVRFSVVLADSEDGESSAFTGALHRWGLHDVVAIRSTQGVWLRAGQRVRQTRWRPFERVFTDGGREQRFIREPIDGTRQAVRSSQITTDPATLPSETTGDRMTHLPGTIEQTVGTTLGWRTWVEYGFKPAKDDLGWADSRLTDAASIERWWELVMSADTLVSLQQLVGAAHDQATAAQPASAPTAAPPPPAPTPAAPPTPLAAHPAWDAGTGWKHELNNLRLLLQPFVCTCLLLPWLQLVPPPHLQAVQSGLAALGTLVNTFRLTLPT